jgi:hypothetical protein
MKKLFKQDKEQIFPTATAWANPKKSRKRSRVRFSEEKLIQITPIKSQLSFKPKYQSNKNFNKIKKPFFCIRINQFSDSSIQESSASGEITPLERDVMKYLDEKGINKIQPTKEEEFFSSRRSSLSIQSGGQRRASSLWERRKNKRNIKNTNLTKLTLKKENPKPLFLKLTPDCPD